MSDSPVTDWALGQIKAHGAEPLLGIGLACVAVGVAIGWFGALIKAKAEIAKLKQEARKASGDNIEKLAQKRALSNSKSQDLDLAKRNMIESLRKNKAGIESVEALRSCREELCNIYQNDCLPATSEYKEMIPQLVDKGDALIRAETELIPHLESFCKFLEIVNMEEMISKIPNAQLFKLNRARRDGLLLRVKTLIPCRCLILRWKLRQIKQRTDKHLRK